MKHGAWKVLCSSADLNLEKTLLSGQTFRWAMIDSAFCTTFDDSVVGLKEENGQVFYSDYGSGKNIEPLLKSYFRLEVDMSDLYIGWAKDAHFKKITGGAFNGVRMLKQDPVEVIFQFICSQNNNIKRIGSLVEKMAVNFGSLVGNLEDQKLYSFPTLKQLVSTNDLEQQLRDLGFGYRAKYISKTAADLHEKPKGWVKEVEDMEYTDAKTELLKLSGVGPKVADCILLFGFGHARAIPVDTHVWQIAKRDYKMKIGDKLNPTVYASIGAGFYDIFGSHCGWAHTLLFVADLKGSISVPAKRALDVKDRVQIKEE